MSFHLNAKNGDVAETVILPGDPLRAKYVAEKYLDSVFCYNEIRGMFGYTGYFKGKKVSIQGTGMGIPSIAIYVTELLQEYGAKRLIRIGTCGSIQPELKAWDIILAISASSNSSLNNILLGNGNYAPTADFELLQQAYNFSKNKNYNICAGTVLSSDIFYNLEDNEHWKKWANYGVSALEMETAGLYTIAARFKAKALSILTVSDCIWNKSVLDISSEEKENNLDNMIQIALDLV